MHYSIRTGTSSSLRQGVFNSGAQHLFWIQNFQFREQWQCMILFFWARFLHRFFALSSTVTLGAPHCVNEVSLLKLIHTFVFLTGDRFQQLHFAFVIGVTWCLPGEWVEPRLTLLHLRQHCRREGTWVSTSSSSLLKMCSKAAKSISVECCTAKQID